MKLINALLILGINERGCDKDLQKAYRRAAAQNHPDRGGDTAAMQKVNEAYALLAASESTCDEDYTDDTESRWQIADALFQSFDLNGYAVHISNGLGEPIVSTDLSVTPYRGRTTYGFSADATFTLNGGVIRLSFYMDLNQFLDCNRIGSGGSDAGVNMSITTEIVWNRRYHKLARRNWSPLENLAALVDPELALPSTKLSAIPKKAIKPYKKQDARMVFKLLMGAQIADDSVRIVLLPAEKRKDELAVTFCRTTFTPFRSRASLAQWQYVGVKKSGQNAKSKYFSIFESGPEGMVSFDTFLDVLLKLKAESTAQTTPEEVDRLLQETYVAVDALLRPAA